MSDVQASAFDAFRAIALGEPPERPLGEPTRPDRVPPSETEQFVEFMRSQLVGGDS